jgi:DNA-binding CsgD family transcriptional regulator
MRGSPGRFLLLVGAPGCGSSYTQQVQLLERETYLAALDDFAADADSGSGRLVIVSGEPGIGKTSLVDVFRESRPDLRWLWGACDGSFTPRPLGPLREIIDQLEGNLPEAVTNDDRHRLFAAFMAELEASPTTTGIVVEDLHWADEATLDWLGFLARRIQRTRALVVVTLREGEAIADGPHRRALTHLVTHRSTRRVSLPPLSTEAVQRLAQGSSRDATQLFELTGGNPFYVVETLAGDADTVPRSVADVVAARVLSVPEDAQRLLQAAAVLVQPSSATTLAAVSGLPGSVIDECLLSGTLVADANTYHFRHELTRRAVEDAVPAFRRAELHRAALPLLESTGADVALLAHHAAGAGVAEKAVRYGTAAGDAAAALASHREAATQYARALENAQAEEVATRAELHEKLALTHALRDHWEDSLIHRQAALAIRRELDEPIRISKNLRGVAVCQWRLCRGAESTDAMESAYRLMVDGPDSSEKGRAIAGYANFGLAPGLTVQLLSEVRSMAERLEDADLSVYTLVSLGCQTYASGGDGSADLEKSLRMALDAGDPGAAAHVYTNLYEGAVNSVQLDESAWIYEEGLPYVIDHDIATYSFCLRATRAQVLVRQGRHDDAIALVGEMAHETMSPINRCHMLLPLGISRIRQGDRSGFDDLLQAWELAKVSDDPEWTAQAATAVAQAAWILGEPALVDDAMIAVFSRPDFQQVWLYAEYAVWLARLGRLESDVRADLPEPWSLELAGQHRGAADAWETRGCSFDKAFVLASSGDPEAVREAITLFTTLGSDLAADRARRILRATGERVPARQRARRTTREHPAGLTAREVEVLELLAEDLTNTQIASRLFLSTRTVDHHVSSVLTKLGASSRGEAVQRHGALTT